MSRDVFGHTSFWRINAFTTQAIGGNAAGVLLMERWADDETLLANAAADRLPATAFVVPDTSNAADYEIVWFSPNAEIRLCGHATLAAAVALLERDGVETFTFRTRHAGIITVRSSPEGAEVSLPKIETQLTEHPEAAKLLGLPSPHCWRSEQGYNVFVLENEAEIRSIKPDFEGLSKLPNDQFIVTAPGLGSNVVSRVFKGGAEAGEDSVTGSAHAVLAPYWFDKFEKSTLAALQLSERGGVLTLRQGNGRIWVGGPCVVVDKR